MTHRHWRTPGITLALAATFLIGPAATFAQSDNDEAGKVFDSLFGAEVRRVEASAGAEDDLTLAQQMLQAAESPEATPAFVERLCEAAFRLSAKANSAAGYDLAAQAMAILADRQPDRARQAGEQRVAALQQAYIASTGDSRSERGQQLLSALVAQSYLAEEAEDYDDAIATLRRAQGLAGALRSDQRAAIGVRLEQLRYQQKIQARIDEARARLKQDRADSDAAKTLVELLIVERDKPKAALPQVELLDEETGRRVGLASKPSSELSADEAMLLGDWYYALASNATGQARLNMMARAQRAYQRYIEQEPGEGLQQVKVTVALQRIEAELGEASLKNTLPSPPSASAAASTRWPVLRDGLTFAWQNAEQKSVRLEARGDAKLREDGWLNAANGSVLVQGVNERLMQMCTRSNQLTIEAVLEPATKEQYGPARIISFSLDGQSRNFTLAQEGAAFNIRLRTTETDNNGMLRNANFGTIDQPGQRFHVLVTFADGRLMGYVNGELLLDRNDVGGDFSNWEPSQLVLGDEFKDNRNWDGAMSHVAIYARALPPAQVAKHWAAVQSQVKAADKPQ